MAGPPPPNPLNLQIWCWEANTLRSNNSHDPLFTIDAQQERDMEWVENAPFVKVFDIWTAYLPADSNVTPQEAAEKIHTIALGLYLKPEEHSDLDGFVEGFFDRLGRIAKQIDCHSTSMQRLVQLVAELKVLPSDLVMHNKRDSQGKPDLTWRIWQDLPTCNQWLGECASIYCVQSWETELFQPWINYVGFLAYLTAKDISDFSYELGIVIADGLWADEDKDLRKHLQSVFKYEFPLAAMVLEISGERLYKECREKRGDYNLELWSKWKGQFSKLAEHKLACEETKVASEKALKAMEEAEQLYEEPKEPEGDEAE